MEAAPVAVIVSRVVDPVQTVAGADIGGSRSRLRLRHYGILLLGWRCSDEIGQFYFYFYFCQLRRILRERQRGQVVNLAIQGVRVRHCRDVVPAMFKSVGDSSAHGLNALFPPR